MGFEPRGLTMEGRNWAMMPHLICYLHHHQNSTNVGELEFLWCHQCRYLNITLLVYLAQRNLATMLDLIWILSVVLKRRLHLHLSFKAIHGLFFFIFVFSIQLTMFTINFFQWLDLNRGPLFWKRPLYQLSLNHCPTLVSYLPQP